MVHITTPWQNYDRAILQTLPLTSDINFGQFMEKILNLHYLTAFHQNSLVDASATIVTVATADRATPPLSELVTGGPHPSVRRLISAPQPFSAVAWTNKLPNQQTK